MVQVNSDGVSFECEALNRWGVDFCCLTDGILFGFGQTCTLFALLFSFHFITPMLSVLLAASDNGSHIDDREIWTKTAEKRRRKDAKRTLRLD